uniref:BTB domain-containing protein n=1 Tax=Heterorhabditis bacteriophora TaxID=37862 RepID=A0A1I7XCZ0_HETBA
MESKNNENDKSALNAPFISAVRRMSPKYGLLTGFNKRAPTQYTKMTKISSGIRKNTRTFLDPSKHPIELTLHNSAKYSLHMYNFLLLTWFTNHFRGDSFCYFNSPLQPKAVNITYESQHLSVCDFVFSKSTIHPLSSKYNLINSDLETTQVNDHRRVTVFCVASENTEWKLVSQLRIKTGGGDSSILKVVDKDVFEFSRFTKPISVEVMSDAVTHIKFEFRLLNKFIRLLPRFTEGDLLIRFADKSTIRVHRDLLALYSNYMKESTEGAQVTDVGDFPKNAFLEMIYQIYPTGRPIWTDIRALAKAAVAFQATPLIYAISMHLVEFNKKPMSFEDKLSAAIEMGLTPAIKELVFRATQDGVWNQMIRLGFEPEVFFGAEVYKKLVCPSIIDAHNMAYASTYVKNPCSQPDFFSLKSSELISTATIIFRGTPFYVNRGILAIHGTDRFGTGPNGEFIAIFSRGMEVQCAAGNILPGEVFAVLTYYLCKKCIEFTALPNGEMNQKKGQGRINVILSYFNPAFNFLFVFSCNSFANELLQCTKFCQLSQRTRDLITDRLCSGWGLEPKHVNKLATRDPTSFRDRQVGLARGGPSGFEDEKEAATLAEMESEIHFGLVGELCVVEN